MAFLLKENVRDIYRGNNIYTDKVLIFESPIRFVTMENYSLLFEQVLLYMDNMKKDEDLKKHLLKLLNISANMKNFDVGDFNNYNKEEYRKVMAAGIEKMDETPIIRNFIVELNAKELNEEEYDIYSNKFPEIKELSIFNLKEKGFVIFFPDEIFETYKNCIVLSVEKITGDFETDVVLSLLNIIETLGISTQIKDYGISYDICTLGCHQEFAFALKRIIGTMVYWKNCSSTRDNKLYGFDEIYFHNELEYVKCMIERTKNLIH